MENTQNAEEIDLLELLRALKKRILTERAGRREQNGGCDSRRS